MVGHLQSFIIQYSENHVVVRQHGERSRKASHIKEETVDAQCKTVNPIPEETVGIRQDTAVDTVVEIAVTQQDTITSPTITSNASVGGGEKRRKRNIVEVSIEEDLNKQQHKVSNYS
jgi:hypothetical protein